MKGFRVVVLTAGLSAAAVILGIAGHPAQAVVHGAATHAAQAETQPVKTGNAKDPGAAVYAKNCAICHGSDRQGDLPWFPPLGGISHRLTNDQITSLVHSGKGRMPAFPKVEGAELNELLHFLASAPAEAAATPAAAGDTQPSPLVASGENLFHQNCAFCHGRDAMGGETGPDLTQSKLVLADKEGDKIIPVVHEGRPETKMPGFNFNHEEMASLVAFIHARTKAASENKGARRGVSLEDLQTGDAEAGKTYFNGNGGCAKCHSATGDLAGIANRYQGLKLEEQMLYPRDARSTVTVTLSSGEKVSGTLAYRDEWVIGLRDKSGTYRSWAVSRVKYTVNSPAEYHAEQFPKYTDDDIHNLMKYLQTLK